MSRLQKRVILRTINDGVFGAEGIQETAGTACALNTLGIQSRRADLMKTAQRILKSLDARTCPVVKLLRVAAAAEIAHAKSNWQKLDELERSANNLIMKLDPADHWNVRGVLEFLRRSVNKNRIRPLR
ncbi:MAG: hypothetical protein AABN95_24535 [Acidobacteriota bacterium]